MDSRVRCYNGKYKINKNYKIITFFFNTWIDMRIIFWNIVVLYKLYREYWECLNTFVHYIKQHLSTDSGQKYSDTPNIPYIVYIKQHLSTDSGQKYGILEVSEYFCPLSVDQCSLMVKDKFNHF
jgi:hypothetical protein